VLTYYDVPSDRRRFKSAVVAFVLGFLAGIAFTTLAVLAIVMAGAGSE